VGVGLDEYLTQTELSRFQSLETNPERRRFAMRDSKRQQTL
jgi:hypothetical protein